MDCIGGFKARVPPRVTYILKTTKKEYAFVVGLPGAGSSKLSPNSDVTGQACRYRKYLMLCMYIKWLFPISWTRIPKIVDVQASNKLFTVC